MKKDYYIIKKDGEYSWTVDLQDEDKQFVVDQGKTEEAFIKLTANKKIGDLKRKDGIIEDLPEHFIGKGEVDGFVFDQVYKDDNFYVYKVQNNYYEVFDKVFYGNKVKYPKGEDFGFTAWTYTKKENLIRFVKAKYKVDLSDIDL